MNIQFSVDGRNPSERRGSGDTTNIVFAANLSGKAVDPDQKDAAATAGNMFNLDLFDVDGAIGRIKPVITISVGDERVAVEVNDMDDFHPDSLYRRLEVFAVTRQLKSALADPASAEQAAEVCRRLFDRPAPAPVAARAVEPAGKEPDNDMFARLLGQSQSAGKPVSNTVRKLLDDAVSEDLVAPAAADSQQLSADLDAWNQDAMREVLRAPEYRSVECAWRALEWLGQQIESDEELNVWIVDTGTAVPESWCRKVTAPLRQKLAGEPVDLVITMHELTDSASDMQSLASLASFGEQLACPVLACAAPSLAGTAPLTESHIALDQSDFGQPTSESWQAFRKEANAKFVALAFPRMLLRQPFGERSDPVDSFAFNELESAPDHDAFCWSASAVAVAAMWLKQRSGDAGSLQANDLPTVSYDDGSGQAIKPPTEVYLSDSAAERILENGLIPLIGQRGHTDIRTLRLQSSAEPATGL